MSAKKLTPENCFQATSRIAEIGSDTVTLENQWMIFGLPHTDRHWKGKEVVAYYREEGCFAESSTCGLKIDNEMIFFDENCDLRDEFFKALRNGDTSRLIGWIKSNQRLYPDPSDVGDQIVWVITFDGVVYWMMGGNHRILYNKIRRNVFDLDIVAAGRVWHSPEKVIWESDLLKKRTDEALRPTLTPILLKLK